MTLSILWGPSVVTSAAPAPTVAETEEMLRYTRIRNRLVSIARADERLSTFAGRPVLVEKEADLDTPDKTPWINFRVRREERETRTIAAGIQPYVATVSFDIEVAVWGVPEAKDPSAIEEARDDLLNLVEEVMLAPTNLTQDGYWDQLRITGVRFEGMSGFLESNPGFLAGAAIGLEVNART